MPLSIVHAAAHDTILDGHRIPKGTWMFPMLYAVNGDDKAWEDPDAFKPERFLGTDGKCHRPDNLMPFGIGKILSELVFVLVVIEFVFVVRRVIVHYGCDRIIINE